MSEPTTLDRLKEDSGLTWAAIAQHAGITDAGLARIRKGEVKPRRDTLAKLERVLGVEPGTLIDQYEVTNSTGQRPSGKTALTAWLDDSVCQWLGDARLAALQNEMRAWVGHRIGQIIADDLGGDH